ncbi:alpha/beta hydrolase [Ruicaihuangia caeni]|uniref:alpha/beta hydrolase n=1 Tax=Ruicaihuangia caeni TaxID=3042517 RepID=UPI00338E65B8
MRRVVSSGAMAAVGAAALMLSGCSLFAPPMVSTPTLEPVDKALERFYHQELDWKKCADGIFCATAIAPMDWSDPDGETIELALASQPATGSSSLGSVLVNPGGPGASGRDFVLDSVDFATTDRLQGSYDIVGFDPRGVGRSSAVSCHDDPRQLDAYLYDIAPGAPGSDAWIDELRASAADFGEACLEHTGPLLEFVDTESAARDLDMLRAVLGDEKLNYLGYSYGTFLGATYADLFPENTGRLVFDGALDPATSSLDVTVTQAKGFENAMRAYLASCLGDRECPFSGSVDSSMQQIRQLLDQLDASPLRHSDGRMLGSSTMFTAIILPLYNEGNWPLLNQLFTEVFSGNAETAFFLADYYNDRTEDGEYSTNQTEAFLAINCLDYDDGDPDNDELRAEAAFLKQEAPIFGPQMSYGVTCASWPFDSVRERVAIAAEGSSDILVVGTTNDPATPYVWAQNMARQLQNGHLVTHNGEGHTAYGSNDCVNRVVDDYFIDGTVPASDPQC